LIDPESSLNPTGEKIVGAICAGKTIFMGFPFHINATIGTACEVRSEKKFFTPVNHRFIGRVKKWWTDET